MACHVLLIEDEPNIAEAIRFLLGREGLTVSSLSDGIGAAAAVQAQKPDLVILDLMLPGCSGLDVLEAIDREAAERAGVDRFMTKPFSNAEMLAQVRELVGR